MSKQSKINQKSMSLLAIQGLFLYNKFHSFYVDTWHRF